MIIRKAKTSEISSILEVYKESKQFMIDHGNKTQWPDWYPKTEDILVDIDLGRHYVCIQEDQIVGTFFMILGLILHIFVLMMVHGLMKILMV